MGRFTAKFTTRKRYQDTDKVYNQETTKIPSVQPGNVPRYQSVQQGNEPRYQSVQPGKGTKIYNQKPRYQQSVQPGKGTKIPTSRVLFRIFCLGEKIRVEIDGGWGVCGRRPLFSRVGLGACPPRKFFNFRAF